MSPTNSVNLTSSLKSFVRHGASNALGISEEASLGHGVEAAEQGEAGIGDECHDVALALDGPQLEGESGAQGMAGRDHARPRQCGMLGECLDIEADEIGDEQEEAADLSGEVARGEREGAHIGDSFRGRPDGGGPLFVEAARQWGEALGFEHFAHCGGAERRAGLLERGTDLVDRVVALSEGDDLSLGPALVGLAAGTWPRCCEEFGELTAAEGMAQHPESAGRIAEASGDLNGRLLVEEVGAQGFVLALPGGRGLGEEALAVC